MGIRVYFNHLIKYYNYKSKRVGVFARKQVGSSFWIRNFAPNTFEQTHYPRARNEFRILVSSSPLSTVDSFSSTSYQCSEHSHGDIIRIFLFHCASWLGSTLQWFSSETRSPTGSAFTRPIKHFRAARHDAHHLESVSFSHPRHSHLR